MSKSGELGALTRGERLLVDRRRRGESQSAAAKRLKTNRRQYNNWELDKDGDVKPPTVAVGRLQAFERCLLMRRRAAYSQAKVAKQMKCSRFWLNQMEQGKVDCTALCGYWES